MMNSLPRFLRLATLSVLLPILPPVIAKDDNSTSLFNGKTLAGWTVLNGGQFTVSNGLLSLNRGTGWLRSTETYGDFKLTLEVRFNEVAANSGIFVRTGPTSHDDESGWPDHGYQVQCMDTAEGEHPLGTLIAYGAGEFDQIFDPTKIAKAKNPAPEWNLMEITCRGESLSVRLNGELISISLGVRQRSGHIGIQGEHGPLDFRRIEIEQL
ncbi:MAG: DUF1080 domain-containing protein [Candidatus Synoicihabitans palmerolidicus]|nr:DUF1080 domain-containing protein [Candidatus Synoicihabitans palmerolidicus]